MKITKNMIGKYATRIGPCKLGNGNKDYSYIGDKIKILSIDEKHIRFATKEYKSTLDERWLDDNWKEYEEVVVLGMKDENDSKTAEEFIKKDAVELALCEVMLQFKAKLISCINKLEVGLDNEELSRKEILEKYILGALEEFAGFEFPSNQKDMKKEVKQ